MKLLRFQSRFRWFYYKNYFAYIECHCNRNISMLNVNEHNFPTQEIPCNWKLLSHKGYWLSIKWGKHRKSAHCILWSIFFLLLEVFLSSLHSKSALCLIVVYSTSCIQFCCWMVLNGENGETESILKIANRYEEIFANKIILYPNMFQFNNSKQGYFLSSIIPGR